MKYRHFSEYDRKIKAAHKRFLRASLLISMLIYLFSVPRALTAEPAVDNWLDIVRSTPYWASKGAAANLADIRRWVLLGESFCAQEKRHLLFDHRGQFLGYINNADSADETIARLNESRQRMVREQRAKAWSPGARASHGYPFALACHQPYADMTLAIARMDGSLDEHRLWGTWDGMQVGDANNPVSLVQLFREVYEHRKQQGRYTFPDTAMSTLLGKIIIESGGQKHAHSEQAARGIMQLRPAVLDDCEIPESFHLHRMAQVDCALRLIEQNHRNLRDPFTSVFGDLPENKREVLYGLLLTQAYQIGVGRSTELLKDPELGRAARFFAEHHAQFSAEDILVGMIYHNMGRRDLGLRTLYYVTDARIAAKALCASPAMADDDWCQF